MNFVDWNNTNYPLTVLDIKKSKFIYGLKVRYWQDWLHVDALLGYTSFSPFEISDCLYSFTHSPFLYLKIHYRSNHLMSFSSNCDSSCISFIRRILRPLRESKIISSSQIPYLIKFAAALLLYSITSTGSRL